MFNGSNNFLEWSCWQKTKNVIIEQTNRVSATELARATSGCGPLFGEGDLYQKLMPHVPEIYHVYGIKF